VEKLTLRVLLSILVWQVSFPYVAAYEGVTSRRPLRREPSGAAKVERDLLLWYPAPCVDDCLC